MAFLVWIIVAIVLVSKTLFFDTVDKRESDVNRGSAVFFKSNQIKSIFVYLMLKGTTTVTDANVVYRKLLGGHCYTS